MVKSPAVDDHPFACIDFPALPPKPRTSAVTALLDKGIGVGQARDLVATAGDLVDVIKLGWGSARLQAGPALGEKVAIYRAAGIKVCSGGTFCELAFAQDRVAPFLAAARDLGLDMVEVSNGVHPMSDDDKTGPIAAAYAAQGARDRFSYYIEKGSGHVLSAEMWRRTKAWFARHLRH